MEPLSGCTHKGGTNIKIRMRKERNDIGCLMREASMQPMPSIDITYLAHSLESLLHDKCF